MMNVLYATDGSACAATAGRLLLALSLPPEARVTVLSAVPESGWVEPPLIAAEGSLYPMLAEVAQEEQAAALQTAEAAAAPFRERGFKVIVTVRRENPGAAILTEARAGGAELIVVGSHGKGAVERFLLGSVSERVARYAHCSVLVARGDQFRRAIVAVDGSESAERALDALRRLPLPAEMELTLVHVLRPGAMPPAMPLGPGRGGEEMIAQYDRQAHTHGEQIVRHAQAHLRHAGRETKAEMEVRCGAPADEIVAAARATGADLIVVGAANRSALGRLFLGSVSGRVLSHAPCSVLVARSGNGVAKQKGGDHESDGPA